MNNKVSKGTYEETWEILYDNLEFDSYKGFLNSRYWKRIKEKANNKDYYSKCLFCDNNNVELHHRNYKHIHTDYELGPIIPVCRDHHQLIHDLAIKFNITVQKSTSAVQSFYEKYGYLHKNIHSFDKIKSTGEGRFKKINLIIMDDSQGNLFE